MLNFVAAFDNNRNPSLEPFPLCARALLVSSQLTFSTARPALRSSNQLDIIWHPLRPDLYEPNLIISVFTLTTHADVYSYNFPDDRPFTKAIGEYKTPPPCYLNDETVFLSILCLSAGDRANGIDWGRHLLLVCGRIRQRGTAQALSFRSY